MIRFHVVPSRALAMALLLAIFLLPSPLASAQTPERPCIEETVPADEMQSAGVGLTLQELESLYGEPELGQGSFIFDYQGVHLHKVDCDLILTFALDGGGEPDDEVAQAESLLPADAELVGTVALGSPIASITSNTVWRSPSLAERFASMNEPRGGEILIVYTYEPLGPAIQRIELRSLELAE